jgi:hypothetical protein
MEMGFDKLSCTVALEETDGNENRALDKLLNGDVFVSTDIRHLHDMGFKLDEAQDVHKLLPYILIYFRLSKKPKEIKKKHLIFYLMENYKIIIKEKKIYR